MEKLIIVKVGGAVLEEEALINDFLDHFTAIPSKKILVHGGGRTATLLSKKLGIETKMVDGRRITDHETLKVVTMVYGGLINKSTVALLQSKGCNALGITGVDMNLISAVKRPVGEIDYGLVGDVTGVNASAFSVLIQAGVVPVLAPITHDGKGLLLNTNADTIASSIAVAMADLYQVSLVYCFEKAGVLADPNDDESVIPHLNFKLYQDLKNEGKIHSGMIPKLDNSFNALKMGVTEVIITSANTLNISKGTHLSL
ncbi:MAG: acetylglutamate kinase [Bacteroidota bacterium]|nr:acetylglutamate kinase [Bacteroidota bacterium]